MAAEIGLADVMEHLAIAFGGIYEKLTERDREVQELRTIYRAQQKSISALSNRIEGIHRNLSERIATPADDPCTVARELVAVLERVERILSAGTDAQ